FLHKKPFECKIKIETKDLRIRTIDIKRENFDLKTYSMSWVQFLIWLDQNEPSKSELIMNGHDKKTAEVLSQSIDEYNASNQ
ncbi:MAG: hypothetical protein MI922_05620, partial [Bacteroidales bacterium]|nr:hypothetical protein [Bacteroidales bacterium]